MTAHEYISVLGSKKNQRKGTRGYFPTPSYSSSNSFDSKLTTSVPAPAASNRLSPYELHKEFLNTLNLMTMEKA